MPSHQAELDYDARMNRHLQASSLSEYLCTPDLLWYRGCISTFAPQFRRKIYLHDEAPHLANYATQ